MTESRDQVVVCPDAPELGPWQRVGTLRREGSKSNAAISFGLAGHADQRPDRVVDQGDVGRIADVGLDRLLDDRRRTGPSGPVHS